MENIKVAGFTTLTHDGRQFVAADEVTNLLRAIALLYERRAEQDATEAGTETLSILHRELAYLADTLDVQFIAESGTPTHG